ncbi:methyltransferase type 11 isoform A [Micractinium conductrix]|uniref:Methyltransferase type 11 isoform A n=1 Tax=Micractinium conductrix TaxID=554055 RepID=A0A2P6V0P6_9CHLO|nr:methyltransferase type 11 isoform A [Micractinium conductrix]|eukprot:PSC67659.1 methyltransferase type 11 isoform A [Micractinium conductrix]
MLKPAPAVEALETGRSGRTSGTTDEGEPFLTMEDLRPSAATSQWLVVGITLLPKVSWGWLPFCFTFLGFGPALKLLLFITLFSVFSAAMLYRLYQHSDKQGTTTLADIGEDAFGRRLGRNTVNLFVRFIDVALPSVMHVGGTRFLQTWLFYTTGVCLPYISLLFGGIVLTLVQFQRLGGHQALVRIVQPVLTAVAVAGVLLKLVLLQIEASKVSATELDADAAATNLPYFSDAVIAVVQLISANYMGQHVFMEEISGMASPANFQHSTAWAQVITLMFNLLVALATLRALPVLRVRGFISFAFGPDLLSRLVNLMMWLLMTVKYVITLHVSTKSLLPRLPHLLVSWFDDPDGVDGELRVKPRQLWLLCSSTVVLFSFLVSCTFPHTFLYLSGLLTSVCYIPLAFTLPCLFALKLLGNRITALEYTLCTWVIPVSIIISILGCWASLYHLALNVMAAPADRLKLLAASWSMVAEGYVSSFVPRFAPWTTDTLAQLQSAAAAAPLPPGTIAAPACGPGQELPLLAAAFPQHHILGVDLAEGMVGLAQQLVQREGLGGRVEVRQGDASRLEGLPPLAAVVSVFGLQQMPAPAQVLAAWTRALAPGGVLCVCYWPAVVEGEGGPWQRLSDLTASSRPAPDWEAGIPGAALAAGADVLCDERLAHEMRWPSVEAFWEGIVRRGPWHSRLLHYGEQHMQELRGSFMQAYPDPQAPLAHAPEARLVCLRRRAAAAAL